MRLFLFLIFLLFYLHSYQQPYITKSAALADIDFYNATLHAVHYNPYLYISKSDYVRRTDSIKNSIKDSIELKSFILKLYFLTGLLQDGHASPNVPLSLRSELIKKQFLPFPVVLDEQDNLYVKQLPGEGACQNSCRIISINGLEAKGFVDKAIQNTGGLPAYKKEVVKMLFGYYLFLHNILPPFKITWLDDKQQRHEKVVAEGVDFKTALSLSVPNSNKPAYSFSIVNNKIGYIDFVSMTGSHQVFDRFLDTSFSVMRKSGINTLAVDLRKNTGGNSVLADLLLSYITRKELSLMGTRYWKVSQQYKDYLRSSGDSTHEYLRQVNGSIWQRGKCGPRKQMFKVDTIFKGKVYFLTGSLTYSSANMLADAVKQYKLATLIGEPTGESTNDFGEVYTMELPNSKVKVQVTTAFDIGADCKKDHTQPVTPDILIPTTTANRLNSFDPVIDFISRKVSER